MKFIDSEALAMTHLKPPLILASASPRRAELLQQIQLDFTQRTVDIDESICDGEIIFHYAERMASEKAVVAWNSLTDEEKSGNPIVLSADTCGEFAGQLLCKPVDYRDAQRILRLLSGNTHHIYSAFSLFDGNKQHTELVTSQVTFKQLSDAEILAYWQSGEPCDKAGAYAIQGLGAKFITHLSGSYSAVMGLPLFELLRALSDYR